MMPDEIAKCNDCIGVILWQWGHGGQINAQAIKDLTTLIWRKLELNESDPKNIGPMLAQIDKLANKGMVSSSPFIVNPVSVNSVIEERITELKANVQYRFIDFRRSLAPDLPRILVNRDWLRRLLDILIDNAIESMEKSPEKNLIISTAAEEEKVRISIQDTGGGISPEKLADLFMQPHIPGELGRGRGAYVAQLIADIYGGSIDVDITDSKGTTIIIWIPIPQSLDLKRESK